MRYTYNKFCEAELLEQEIKSSPITIATTTIYTNGNNTTIEFKTTLSSEEEAVLYSIIQAHYPLGEDLIQHVKIVDMDIDSQGRQVHRVAAGQKGWSYMAHPLEFETSKINSLYEKINNGLDRNTAFLKFYDIYDTEVTTSENEVNIVKTVLTFKPDYDYELISGSIRQITTPNTDIRVWVIGGILELGVPYTKEFAGGINLKFYGQNESLKTDGRAAKYMKKDIEEVLFQANQLQIIVKHEAGFKHKLMAVLEYFRA
jgi:hypothetical protein